MNPFDMGGLAMTGWSNPDMFANMMASQGIAPGMPVASGANMDPLAQLFNPVPATFGQAVPGPAAAPAAPGVNPAAALAMSGLGSVKAPQSPAPIMNAGVSGSQKAPEAKAGAGASQMQQAVLAMLLNQANKGPAVPSLGSLIGKAT